MEKVIVVTVEPEKGKIFSHEMCNCLEKMIVDFFFLQKMRVTSNKKGAVIFSVAFKIPLHSNAQNSPSQDSAVHEP